MAEIAVLAGNAGHAVHLWCRGAELAAELESTRINKPYLPNFALPAGVVVTTDLETAVRGKEIVVGVTPSHGIREVLGVAAGWLRDDAIVVNASKGLEDGTLSPIDDLYRSIFPARIAARATFLSGPTFANEIATGMPSAIVLAGRDAETTAHAQKVLSTDRFRI